MKSTDPINLCSDSELISLTQNEKSSEEAFKEIDKRYRNNLLSYLKASNLQWDEIEDIVQEVFIKLAVSISQKTYKEKGKLAQFLRKMARNQMIDAIRRKSNFRNISVSNWPSFENNFSNSEKMQLTISGEIEERDPRVVKLLSILSENQKQVFELRINQELMFSEISKETKIPLQSVVSRFHNGRKKILRTLVSMNLTSQDFGYK